MRVVASTGRSLAMSPELSAGDVGEVTVVARLAPELAIGVVKICALRDKAPSMWLPLQFSFGRRTVERRDSSLPFFDESEPGLVRLVAVPRQLPRYLLQEMLSHFRNDPSEA